MVYFGDLVRRFAFGFAIFTSAFLLFQVQLLLGKFLLRWFGGASGIWALRLSIVLPEVTEAGWK